MGLPRNHFLLKKFISCFSLISLLILLISLTPPGASAASNTYFCGLDSWGTSCIPYPDCNAGYSAGACSGDPISGCLPPSSNPQPCNATPPTPTPTPTPTATPTPTGAPVGYCSYAGSGAVCGIVQNNCTGTKVCPVSNPGCAPTLACVTPGAIPPTVAARMATNCAGGTGIETGIGCIPVSAAPLATRLVQIIVGFVGGIVLLLFIAGAAQFAGSSGDPDSIEEARGKITAAVSGLLIILFSVLLLKVIGVDILSLPGLSSSGGSLTVPGP